MLILPSICDLDSSLRPRSCGIRDIAFAQQEEGYGRLLFPYPPQAQVLQTMDSVQPTFYFPAVAMNGIGGTEQAEHKRMPWEEGHTMER